MNYKNTDIDNNRKIIIEELNDITKKRAYDASLCREEYVSLVLEEDGDVYCRLVGLMFFNILHIELFWTNENYRGRGFGTKTLSHVENMAKNKGCRFVFLETLSFYAPKFYIERGYEIIKEISDSPIKGESHYFMLKILE